MHNDLGIRVATARYLCPHLRQVLARRTRLPIIVEQDVGGDVERLDRSWSEAPTFAYLPHRAGRDQDWVTGALAELPDELHTGHFALLTSGSTGRPKLVVGQRGRAERLTEVLHEVQASAAVAQTVVVLPLSYCYAFVNQWLWARRFGRGLITSKGLAQPDQVDEVLSGARDAMLCLVGAQVPLLIRYFAGRTFPGVIRIHFAGGRFPQERLADVRALFPAAVIYNNYGCAEAMPRLTVRPAEAAESAEEIGAPIPGVELQVDDEGALFFRSRYGAVACVDEAGVKLIGPDDWTATGDLGERLPGGQWRLLGRSGEVFKRYGEKISIPALLATVNALWSGESTSYREVDPAGEPGWVLVLSPAPTDPELKALLQALRRGHSRPHWPVRIESVAALPHLPSRKLDSTTLLQTPRIVHWRQIT